MAIAAVALLGSAFNQSLADTNACFARLAAAIDIGHSRSSPGAKDVFGRDELDYNYELAVRIEGELIKAGIGRVVVVNRGLDTTSLPERPQKAFCSGADLFISVHHDNVDDNLKVSIEEQGRHLRYNDRIEGYTVYYSSQNAYADLSRALSLSVAEALLKEGVVPATPYQDIISDDLRKAVSPKLNVFDFSKLKVSQASPIPAILLEAGFISNKTDITRLRNPEYQTRIARGVIQGVRAICEKHPELAGLNKAVKARGGACGSDRIGRGTHLGKRRRLLSRITAYA